MTFDRPAALDTLSDSDLSLEPGLIGATDEVDALDNLAALAAADILDVIAVIDDVKPDDAPPELDGFDAFGLSEPLRRGIAAAGFLTPSPIQAEAIPAALSGRDVIARARTGTGKTAAFGLPCMHRLRGDRVDLLVLVPTRELAAQVSDELFKLGRFAGVKSVAVYGGQNGFRQVELVNSGAQVVVATPGRLLDHLTSRRFKDFKPRMVVLDEADEMLSMGFLDALREIFGHLPPPGERQTLLFSATLPSAIKGLARDILRDPVTIDVATDEATALDIEQVFCVVRDAERSDALLRLLDVEDPAKAIVFCRTRAETEGLCTELLARGAKVRAIHGDIEQSQRQEVLRSFKTGNLRVLVATDVAARGIDVADVSHVFNYHLPFDQEGYVHRIGRTGRAGRKGKAVTLITPVEYQRLRRFLAALKMLARGVEVPSRDALLRARVERLAVALSAVPTGASIDAMFETLTATTDAATLARQLLALRLSEMRAAGPERIGMDERQLAQLTRPGGGRMDGPRGGGGGYYGGSQQGGRRWGPPPRQGGPSGGQGQGQGPRRAGPPPRRDERGAAPAKRGAWMSSSKKPGDAL